MHVAISSGYSIEVIEGVHGTIESLMNVDIETNETSTLSIESLSYSDEQDKIYAARMSILLLTLNPDESAIPENGPDAKKQRFFLKKFGM